MRLSVVRCMPDKAMAVGNHIDHPDPMALPASTLPISFPAYGLKKATKPRRSTMGFRSLKYMMLAATHVSKVCSEQRQHLQLR
ncbi:hypothetical protein OH492_12665 [Vibrio chagasii]|nr:hypothetical protein [Vibrio chagasii]